MEIIERVYKEMPNGSWCVWSSQDGGNNPPPSYPPPPYTLIYYTYTHTNSAIWAFQILEQNKAVH